MLRQSLAPMCVSPPKYLRGNTSQQHSSERQYQSLHSPPLWRLHSLSFHGPPQAPQLKYRRCPATSTFMLNELSLLKSYLEIPTERHMWNWEWFSASTGSHLHKPTTSHPHLKPVLEPLCSLFPADQWDPDRNPGHKRNQFPWKLLPTNRKKGKSKGRPFTADLFRGQKGGFGSVWEGEGWARRWSERKKETISDRQEEWTHAAWEEEKRGGAVSTASFLSHSRHRTWYIWWVRRKKQEAVSSFQGCVHCRNRSTGESWVITGTSFEKSTLSLEKPRLPGCDCGPRTHSAHTANRHTDPDSNCLSM